jgi:hypothetical protein
VSLHRAAISKVVGVPELFFGEQGESLASLCRQSDAQTNAQKVPVNTADQFCDENGVARIQFQKIDTEGQEMEVLRGALRMIQEGRIDFVQFEFGDTFLNISYHFIDVWDYLSIEITESFAMWPGSSVSGFYFAHPGSRYFSLGKIDRD